MSDIKRQTTLINDAYLKEYGLFPKNYDLTEIHNFIPIAEQIHVIPIIGVPLYEELMNQIVTNTLTEENSTLLLEIYKVLGIAVFYEALPFVYAHVSEVGITKGNSDNSDSINGKDLSYIIQHTKSQLDFARKYLHDWLNAYSDNFPLYTDDDCDECGKTKIIYSKDIYHLPKDRIDLI